MKTLNRWSARALILSAFFYVGTSAMAQWQVPDHSVPIGRGTGTGFKNALSSATGQAFVGNGGSADPSFTLAPTWNGLHTFNSGLTSAIGQTVTVGTVTLSDVNNSSLVVGNNQVIQFTGANGGFRFGNAGIAAYTEGSTDTVNFQNSTPNTVTALQVQPNGSPVGDPVAWSSYSMNFQPGPNEERYVMSALFSGGVRQYGFFEIALGTGQYHPVVFYGNGTTESFRINADTDSSSFFKQPVAFGANTLVGGGGQTAFISVVKDANIGANGNSAQIQISSSSNNNERLFIGRDTTNHRSRIDSATVGSSLDPLDLNPSGGLISVGSGGQTNSGQITSTVTTGTAPMVVASTTRVSNLNVARAAVADSATTNANLTGPITSVGNGTAIASQTGTGTKFVVDTAPTLVTPNVGVATATSINKVAITAPASSATLTIADGKTLAYDEGTWTPTIAGDTGVGTTTYTAQVGSYERVGRLVTARFQVTWSVNSGMSGNLQVRGLPLTSSATANDFGGCSINYMNGVTFFSALFTWMSGIVLTNSTNIQMEQNGSAVSSAGVNVTGVAAAGGIQGFCNYHL